MATNDEDKRKHLEFIQNVITRMASNTFIIKGWAITAVGAIYAYWLANQDYRVLFLILAITIFFWGHDAFYLRQERSYRELYYKVVDTDPKKIDYSMNAPRVDSAFFRPILLRSYGVIVVVTLVLIYIYK